LNGSGHLAKASGLDLVVVRYSCEHMFLHNASIQQAAMTLIAAGVNDCEIARRLGLPRTTVRDWRRPQYKRRGELVDCPRCWRPSRPMHFAPADYAELLGLYLGDGHITTLARTQRLRVFLDARHSNIVDETEALLQTRSAR
jgi:hypothetical protein